MEGPPPRCAKAQPSRLPSGRALRSAGLGAKGPAAPGALCPPPACPLPSIEKGGEGAQHLLPRVGSKVEVVQGVGWCNSPRARSRRC